MAGRKNSSLALGALPAVGAPQDAFTRSEIPWVALASPVAPWARRWRSTGIASATHKYQGLEAPG